MAEVLGLLSSLVACYEVLTPAVKYVGQLYKAPREVKALQEQINGFDVVIKSIEKSGNSSQSPILVSALDDGRTIVEEVNTFIATKLHTHTAKRKSSYYSSWARHRRKFMKFGDKLERNRRRVKEAMLTEVYVTLHPPVPVSNYGKRGTLRISPTDGEAQPHDPSPPSMFQKPHAEEYDDVCISQSVALRTRSHNVFSGENLGHTSSSRSNEEPTTSPPATLACRSQFESDYDSDIAKARPVSVFESLSSFRPELYAENADKTKLYTYFVQEAQVSPFLRITDCALFYLNASQRWMRITASVTSTHDSDYWDVTKGRATSLGVVGNYNLPIALNSRVEAYLATHTELMQDCHLDIFVGKGQPNKASIRRGPPIELTERLLCPGVRQLLERAMENFTHSGLPWYEEAQLDMRQAYRFNYPDNFFYAWLESRWVYACRFGTETAHVNIDLYTLKVLNAVRGSRGLAPLLGVFSDRVGSGIINGFLVELPSKGSWKGAQNETFKTGEQYMRRRIRWCKELLQGLANIHKRGLVSGPMFGPGCRVGIDANDRAIFYGGFSTQIDTHGMRTGILPPEHKSLTVTNGHIDATYRTDLYHIGFLMWRILEDETWPSDCTLASCPTPSDKVCTISHPKPIQLRPIDESIPEYMRDIISICRSEDPSDRLPAWTLLDMFPDDIENNTEKPSKQVLDRLVRLEACYEIYRCHMSCERCGDVTTAHQFHCNLCGDYDICPKCFGIGYHCRDDSHWLREYFKDINEDRYWNCQDKTGQRQLVVI